MTMLTVDDERPSSFKEGSIQINFDKYILLKEKQLLKQIRFTIW